MKVEEDTPMSAMSETLPTYLLVEDNDDHAVLIERCFRRGKFAGQIRRTFCGVDCLAYLDGRSPYSDRTQSPYPDIIFLDIRMSGTLDGLHTLQAIRSDPRHRFTQVFMLSSSNRDQDIKRAYALGANGYVPKSFEVDEMTERLQRVQGSGDT
jgi:CheY-like chemotaxis protein